MDIKQEIAELKAKLAELEAKANAPLDCYFGNGFYIAERGEIDDSSRAINDNDYTQIRNKETAELAQQLVQIQRALINFKCEHDLVFDDKHVKTMYTIEYFRENSEWNIGSYNDINTIGSVWFSTEELAESALDMLKRRNLV